MATLFLSLLMGALSSSSGTLDDPFETALNARNFDDAIYLVQRDSGIASNTSNQLRVFIRIASITDGVTAESSTISRTEDLPKLIDVVKAMSTSAGPLRWPKLTETLLCGRNIVPATLDKLKLAGWVPKGFTSIPKPASQVPGSPPWSPLDVDGENPLITAYVCNYSNRMDRINWLLTNGFSIDHGKSSKTLSLAEAKPLQVQRPNPLTKKAINWNFEGDTAQWGILRPRTLAQFACMTHDLDLYKFCITKGADPLQKDQVGCSLLAYALRGFCYDGEDFGGAQTLDERGAVGFIDLVNAMGDSVIKMPAFDIYGNGPFHQLYNPKAWASGATKNDEGSLGTRNERAAIKDRRVQMIKFLKSKGLDSNASPMILKASELAIHFGLIDEARLLDSQ